jgi:hypothetical protein
LTTGEAVLRFRIRDAKRGGHHGHLICLAPIVLRLRPSDVPMRRREGDVDAARAANGERSPHTPAQQQIGQRDPGDGQYEHEAADRTVEDIHDAAGPHAASEPVELENQ